jgi:hypothetical protein
MTGNTNYWSERVGLWVALYWTALGVSFFFSVLAASNLLPDNRPFRFKSGAALLAALATSFLASFNPQAQADRYRTSYLYMKAAVATYRFDPRMTTCHLVRAYVTAESIAQRGVSAATPPTTR